VVASVVGSMTATGGGGGVTGGVGGDAADGVSGKPAWHSVDTDILVEATVVGWRMR